MKKQTNAPLASSSLLIADPKAARQFGALGSVLLWRKALPGELRRALLCVPDVCDSPACLGVHIWLGEVDERMMSVSKTPTGLAFVRDSVRFEDDVRIPTAQARFTYDARDGSLIEHDGSAPPDLLEWFKASADADVLTHIKTPLLQREMAAGRYSALQTSLG